MVLCLLCSPHYTAVWIKNCSKSTFVIKVATMKIQWCHMPQLSSETEVPISLLSAMFNSLHSSMNLELFEKYLCNQDSYFEIYGQFLLRKGSHHVQPPNQHFTVSKDEWNTKEDTGKSLKNALDALWYAKRHLSGWSDVEQWKNQAHSPRVTLIWRHQAGS